MNRRRVLLILLGASVGLHAYFVLPGLLRRWRLSSEQEYREQVAVAASSSASEDRLAPVLWWGQAPAGERDYWRARKPARFLIAGGQVMAGGAVVPTGKIRGYLDGRVQHGEIDHVVVVPTRETKWGDIIPVLDECRKSRVQIVVLHPFES